MLLLFIVVATSVGFFAVLKGTDLLSNRISEELIFSYATRNDSEYKVFLKSNNIIDLDYMGENETYITELVNNVEIDFEYSFLGNNETNLNYKYDVYAIVTIEYKAGEKDSNRLWHKRYPIMSNEDKEKTLNLRLSENIVIDYHDFDKQAKLFSQQLQLPINSYVDVYFDVYLEGEYDDEKFDNRDEIKVQIPLNLSAFSITKDNTSEYSGNVYKEILTDPEIDLELAGMGGLLFICSFFSFIILFKKIFNIQQKTEYVINRDKILREFGDIIIEIVTPIDKEDLSVIEVKNFNEMVDLEEELRIPIMFYEDPVKEKGEFSLMHRNILYFYEL